VTVPWEFRLIWTPPNAETQWVICRTMSAARRVCALRAQFGQGFQIDISRRRISDDAEPWEPISWRLLASQLNKWARADLEQLPGYIPRGPA
jgi:hypothetical protein